jgi:D-glycero-beta-D-manno-heptose 1-phosphate adenylyltransferase
MTHLERISHKIKHSDRLEADLIHWRFRKKTIVFTNGCFDILHLGHIDYLSKAADMGDILIVGINTDTSVKRLKGPNRPLCDERSRGMVLASLSFIDCIVYFDEPTPLELITLINPDILVKGNDYQVHDIVGADLVAQSGGKVVTIELVQGYSTTLIEKKILDSSSRE